MRAAGVAWCAGFGRLGGIGGPMLGSTLISAGFKLDAIFYVLAGLGLGLAACWALATFDLVPLPEGVFPLARRLPARGGGETQPQQGRGARPPPPHRGRASQARLPQA